MQRIHNLTLPHWATQDVQDTLRRMASFEVTYSISSHRRQEKAKLTGGERLTLLWQRSAHHPDVPAGATFVPAFFFCFFLLIYFFQVVGSRANVRN